MSIALVFYELLQRAYKPVAKSAVDIAASSVNATGLLSSPEVVEQAEGVISETTYHLGLAVLVFYVFSIVYGRLYTGMHSFTDCIFGTALGAGIWGLHILCGEYVDAWVRNNGIIGA